MELMVELVGYQAALLRLPTSRLLCGQVMTQRRLSVGRAPPSYLVQCATQLGYHFHAT